MSTIGFVPLSTSDISENPSRFHSESPPFCVVPTVDIRSPPSHTGSLVVPDLSKPPTVPASTDSLATVSPTAHVGSPAFGSSSSTSRSQSASVPASLQVNSRPPYPIIPPDVPNSVLGIQTRSKSNIFKPRRILDLHVAALSPLVEPTTYKQAQKSSEWHQAMNEEYDALLRNNTWSLIPADPSQNVIGCK